MRFRPHIALLGSLLLAARVGTAQCPNGTPPPCEPSRAPSSSIAVLTLQSRALDSNDVLLAEGLSDEIASRLAQLPRLTVRSREAVRRLPKAETMSLPELGQRLGATYVLSGTIRPGRDGLNLVMELTLAQSSTVAWTGRYNRGRSDLLDVQVEVATAVARAVSGGVSAAEQRSLSAAPTRDGAAFAHIVRATAFLSRRLLLPAIAEFKAALDRDPGSALAWARLSQAYSLCISNGACADSTHRRLARESADRSLQLDSVSGDAWLADGLMRINADIWDLPAARNSLARAVRLDPQNAEARHVYGFTLLRLGEDSAATDEYRRALAIDAGRAYTWEHLSRIAFARGRYEEMEALADTALALQADLPNGMLWKWQAIVLRGSIDRIRSVAPAYRIGDSKERARYRLFETAYIAVASGDTAAARASVDSLSRSGFFSIYVAHLLARTGRSEEARMVLRAAGLEPLFPTTWYSLRLAVFDSLRGFPEFDSLLERARTRALWTSGASR